MNKPIISSNALQGDIAAAAPATGLTGPRVLDLAELLLVSGGADAGQPQAINTPPSVDDPNAPRGGW
jgi:hypothetical protein